MRARTPKVSRPSHRQIDGPAIVARAGIAAMLMVATQAVVTVAQAPPTSGLTVDSLIGDSISPSESDRYGDVADAIQRFSNRDQLSARMLLERAVEKDKRLPPVGVMVAKMQLLSGNAAAVRPALEQAVQEDSGTDPEPFLILADESLASGRTIEAEALFDKAAQLIESYNANPKRKRRFVIRSQRGRAIIADRRKNWDTAEAALNTWLEEDPNDSNALLRLGQVLFMLDRPSEGYQAFVKAKRENDTLPSPYVSAALMYMRKDETDSALKAFQKAYQEDSTDETTVVAYSRVLVQEGNSSQAASILERARRAKPDSASIWLLSGVVERMAGNLDQAESFLLRALGISPSNRDVLNQLAQTLADSPDRDTQTRALQFANMNAQINQNNPDANITLAWVLFQNGQGARASQAIRQAVQGGALSADGSFLLAKMLLERNDRANAKRLLENALDNNQGIFIQREQAEVLLSTL